MANTNTATAPQSNKVSTMFAAFVIPIAFVIAILIYMFILGDAHNFAVGDLLKEKPISAKIGGSVRNLMGTMYKGGPIVPVILTMLLTVIIFTVERFLTIAKASGKANTAEFVKKIQFHLSNGNVDQAIKECDTQQGSVANVVREGLTKYKEMSADNTMSKDQKVLAIQKEIEEATALEMPMLERNLSVIATIAPAGTLTGLLGTVFGMIRAFAALGAGGAPDSVGLATGISEALVNTFFGILTSLFSIIIYNYFTTRIDKLTYGIDEAGFSIAQNFGQKH